MSDATNKDKSVRAWFPQKENATHFLQVFPTRNREDGEVYSCRFEVFVVTGAGVDGNPRLNHYCIGRDEELAPPFFSGFCKWDGCMQWAVDEHPMQFHVDSMDQIVSMMGVLAAVRTLCRNAIGTWDAPGEPILRPELTTDTVEAHGGVSGGAHE